MQLELPSFVDCSCPHRAGKRGSASQRVESRLGRSSGAAESKSQGPQSQRLAISQGSPTGGFRAAQTEGTGTGAAALGRSLPPYRTGDLFSQRGDYYESLLYLSRQAPDATVTAARLAEAQAAEALIERGEGTQDAPASTQHYTLGESTLQAVERRRRDARAAQGSEFRRSKGPVPPGDRAGLSA